MAALLAVLRESATEARRAGRRWALLIRVGQSAIRQQAHTGLTVGEGAPAPLPVQQAAEEAGRPAATRERHSGLRKQKQGDQQQGTQVVDVHEVRGKQ